MSSFSTLPKTLKWSSASLIAELTEEEKKKMGRPMFGETKLKSQNFKLSESQIEKLEKESKKQKKTKSQIIRDLVDRL